MKYDLIVVGGGPGWLMAAKTAAEDGLKVVMVDPLGYLRPPAC
jgi:flavin-dependent dehydrogenase